MKVYNSPVLVSYGNSNNVIKGACDWGIENITLDRTGSKHITVRANVLHTRQVFAGQEEWYVCENITACDGASSSC